MNLLNEIISAEEIKEMVGTSKLKCGVQVQINRMILRLVETYNPNKPEHKSYIPDTWQYGGDYPICEVVQKELEELKKNLNRKVIISVTNTLLLNCLMMVNWKRQHIM